MDTMRHRTGIALSLTYNRDELLQIVRAKRELHSQEYVEEYDHAIEMLALTTQGEITLSPEMFAKLVQDRWEWKVEFARESGKYLRKDDF